MFAALTVFSTCSDPPAPDDLSESSEEEEMVLPSQDIDVTPTAPRPARADAEGVYFPSQMVDVSSAKKYQVHHAAGHAGQGASSRLAEPAAAKPAAGQFINSRKGERSGGGGGGPPGSANAAAGAAPGADAAGRKRKAAAAGAAGNTQPRKSANRKAAPLNESQRRAVLTSKDQPLIILAGPGSGKTATLTHRSVQL